MTPEERAARLAPGPDGLLASPGEIAAEIREAEQDRDAVWETALRGLLAGFDHVRSCRECGETDVACCADYEPDAAAALRARALAEAVLTSASECG